MAPEMLASGPHRSYDVFSENFVYVCSLEF